MICILYTPKFRTPVSGCFVATRPNVMNFPASFGHDFKIGILSKVGELFIISVTGPLFSNFGNDSLIFDSSGNFLILLKTPDGISIFVISAIL